jgi:hypothetical protein
MVPPGAYPVPPPGAAPGPWGPVGPPPGPPPPPDPHGIGAAVSRLSGNARRGGKVAWAVLASVLDEGDVVAVAVHGRFRGEPGVAALVGERIVLVNERQWKPDVVTFPVDLDLAVQGWQDDRSATLTFVAGDTHEILERIGDRAVAIEMAHRVRQQTGVPTPVPAAPIPGAAPAAVPGPGWPPAPPPPPPA